MLDIQPIYSVFIALIWGGTAFLQYSVYAYYLQLKEYRLDRLKDFAHSSVGHQLALEYPFLWRAVLGLALYVSLSQSFSAAVLFFVLLIADLLHGAYMVKQRGIRRPKMTAKMILILFMAVCAEALLIVYALEVHPAWLLAVFARGAMLLLVAAVIQIPTILAKKTIIFLAKKKIARYKKMRVIGITGSYGKTSVKEFLSHILSEKYTVIKTPRNTNTEIGVAKFILRQSFSQADIFVCEMGAYKMGEIANICDIVKPTIGILTAINNQHVVLFGEIAKTQQAKYELLRAIPTNGYVITNADNAYCVEYLDTLRAKKVHTFGLEPENKPTCLLTDLKAKVGGMTFTVSCEEKKDCIKLETPILGGHHAMNIIPSIMAAYEIGMYTQDIEKAVSTLPTNIHGSIQAYKYGKATILDDSYNSNPRGFRAALDVMNLFSSKKKRIVITRGMLELGEKSDEEHECIGEEIAFIADELVIISDDSYEPLKRGVGEKYRTTVQKILDPCRLTAFIKKFKNEEVIILIENRIPARVSSEINAHKQEL